MRLLNEDAVRGIRTVLNSDNGAVYLHVDDTVVITDASSKLDSGEIMHELSEAFERSGFLVPDHERQVAAEKAVGYAIEQSPALLRLPNKKRFPLQLSLLELAHQRWIDVEVLRAIVGVFSFGALLNRPLFSIMHAIYSMLDKHENEIILLWPSVRIELLALARAIPCLAHHAGRPYSSVLLATDARGPESLDHGGYGIVATDCSEAELQVLREVSELSALQLPRLNGDLSGSKDPERELIPTVPKSRLPSGFTVDERWIPVDAGLWQSADNICIGEARTVVRALRRLGANRAFHNAVYFSLQDNSPTSFSFSKGRSACWGMNFYARKRAASCIAARITLLLPWIESRRQPADSLSRTVW